MNAKFMKWVTPIVIVVSLMLAVNPTFAWAQGDCGSYTVQTGNTLFRIAINHGTSVDAIKSLNGMTSNTIQIGQTLRIPCGSGQQPAKNIGQAVGRIIQNMAADVPAKIPQGWSIVTIDGKQYAVSGIPAQGNYYFVAYASVSAATQALGSGVPSLTVYDIVSGAAGAFRGILVADLVVRGGSIVQQLAEGPATIIRGGRLVYINRITGVETGSVVLDQGAVKEQAEGSQNPDPTPQPTAQPTDWKPGDPKPQRETDAYWKYKDYYAGIDVDDAIAEARSLMSSNPPPYGQLKYLANSTGGSLRLGRNIANQWFITSGGGGPGSNRAIQAVADALQIIAGLR